MRASGIPFRKKVTRVTFGVFLMNSRKQGLHERIKDYKESSGSDIVARPMAHPSGIKLTIWGSLSALERSDSLSPTSTWSGATFVSSRLANGIRYIVVINAVPNRYFRLYALNPAKRSDKWGKSLLAIASNFADDMSS